MTRTTNARVAGFTFLLYIAAGVTSLVLFGTATGGAGIAAKLAGIALHATEMRITVVLGLVQTCSALVLGVTLYAITREQDSDLAMLALACRVVEGIGGTNAWPTLGLLWLATAAGPAAPDTGAGHGLAALLLKMGVWSPSAVFFAIGSTIFCWLLLRGRMIPGALAWLGVGASVLLVVVLPLQLAGLAGGTGSWFSAVTWFMWLPMLVFEVVLALWLIIKGVAAPAPTDVR